MPPARHPLPFAVSRPVVGMVHLPALPGSPGWDGAMDPLLDAAGRDARALTEAGVDGIMVENFGDVPFHGGAVDAATVAALTRAVERVMAEAPGVPVGVNVLRNDAGAALGIAAATGAAFIRVNVHVGSMYTDQGFLTGRAAETLRTRAALGIRCAILADVHVKHATPVPGETLEQAARDAWERGRADALVVSGAGTGRATDPERLRRVTGAVTEVPVWVGSGVTEATLPRLWPHARGFIVGSSLQEGGEAGRRVDRERVRRFMEVVQRLRTGS